MDWIKGRTFKVSPGVDKDETLILIYLFIYFLKNFIIAVTSICLLEIAKLVFIWKQVLHEMNTA